MTTKYNDCKHIMLYIDTLGMYIHSIFSVTCANICMLGLGHFETSVAFRKHFDDQFQHYKEQVGDVFMLIKALATSLYGICSTSE